MVADPETTLHDDFDNPTQVQDSPVIHNREKTFGVLCANILRLDDELLKAYDAGLSEANFHIN